MAYKNLKAEYNGKTYEIDVQMLVSTIAKLEYVNSNTKESELFSKSALKCAKKIMREIIIDPEIFKAGHWNDQRIEQVNFDDFYYDEDIHDEDHG